MIGPESDSREHQSSTQDLPAKKPQGKEKQKEISISGSEDLNNGHAGLLTLANTATAQLQSSKEKQEKDTTVSKATTVPGNTGPLPVSNSHSVASSVPQLGLSGSASGVTQTSGTSAQATQSVGTSTPIMSTNQGPVMAGNLSTAVPNFPSGAPTSVVGSQGLANASFIMQNGQLILVPSAAAPQQPVNADGASQVETPQTSKSSSVPSVLPGAVNANMPAGPGVRMPGIVGIPGAMPGQVMGNQPQIIVGPNGQQILLQNSQPNVGNAPMLNSQGSNDVTGGTGNNQMPVGPIQNILGMSSQPAVANQLQKVLILPNGQV